MHLTPTTSQEMVRQFGDNLEGRPLMHPRLRKRLLI